MSDALKSAIEANDPNAVRKALPAIKDINAKPFNGKSAVALACHLGADKALAALLDANAKVQGKHSEHPFAIAANAQHHAILQLLFDRKKVPEDALDTALTRIIREGRLDTLQFLLRQFKPPITRLHLVFAGYSQNPDVIRALAAAGADLNMTELVQHERITALHQVVSTAPIETLRAMVQAGANINTRDDSGITPLMKLAEHAGERDSQVEGYLQYQQRLQERAKENPDKAPEILNSPAAKQPRPPSAEEVLSAFLALGADATAKDNEGNDSLDYYRFQCRRSKETPENPKVIDLLRSAGAKGHDPTLHLFAAVHKKDLPAVRKAIAAGADVNRINPAHGDDDTPLTRAAGNDLLDIVNILLDAHADPNKPDRMDRPLLIACQNGHLSVVQRLIKAGADPALRQLHDIAEDCPAMNAYETADWMSRKNVMKFLKSIGADKLSKPAAPEPGIHSWDDFAEILARADVPTLANALAKMINGKIQTDVYEKTIKPGKHAFLVVRLKGVDWSNIFQLAPITDWLENADAAQKFAADLAKTANASTLYIGYTDTSDAAMTARFEPAAKPKKKNGKESDNDWLIALAKKENFIAAAFRPALHARQPVEILFPTFPPESFEATACITT